MPKIGGAENAVGGVIPKFYMRPILNKLKSDKAGHAVYDDVEYVEVVILGSNSTRPNYRVTDKYRAKWPKHYQAFKEGVEYIEDGYRLDQWSQMTPAHVETLRGIGVHTLEQFSQLGEDQTKYLGMYNLRQEAVKLLANKDGKQEQIDKLEKQNNDLLRRLEALEKAPKKKKELTPEQKAKRAENLKKAREAKKKKLAEAATAEE